jgi:hypothetical protein
MSNYTGLLPSYRLVGQNILQRGGGWGWGGASVPFYPNAGTYPAVADSYSPEYQSPQTKYGHCHCWGGALVLNSCNYQQGGYRPQCLANGQDCRCTDPTGTDWGCWNTPGKSCI